MLQTFISKVSSCLSRVRLWKLVRPTKMKSITCASLWMLCQLSHLPQWQLCWAVSVKTTKQTLLQANRIIARSRMLSLRSAGFSRRVCSNLKVRTMSNWQKKKVFHLSHSMCQARAWASSDKTKLLSEELKTTIILGTTRTTCRAQLRHKCNRLRIRGLRNPVCSRH